MNGSLKTKTRGVFQRRDSGRRDSDKLWWIRYVGLDGKEHRQPAGTYEEAVTAYRRRRQARKIQVRAQTLSRLGLPKGSRRYLLPLLAELQKLRASLDSIITAIRMDM